MEQVNAYKSIDGKLYNSEAAALVADKEHRITVIRSELSAIVKKEKAPVFSGDSVLDALSRNYDKVGEAIMRLHGRIERSGKGRTPEERETV